MAEGGRRQPDWIGVPLPDGSPAMVSACKDGWAWIMSDEAKGEWELDRDRTGDMLITMYFSDPNTAFEYKIRYG